ncbi:MAG: outer membrane lipoprotein carrier protein LolA [Peptococcaceae bacterium]|nr:MAG: outer membrane lipoprotein carrier protein LolA [Peptococcaceae bacterium]
MFLVALIPFALALVLAGCGKSGQQAENQQSAAGKNDGQVKEESLADLLARGKQAAGMSYEYTLTAGSKIMKGKVWTQGKQVKTEGTAEGQRMISYIDGDTNTVITYDPDQNKAVKLSTGDQQENASTPGEYTSEVDPGKAKVLDTVVYDGVKCKLTAVYGADGKEEMRMWVREDYGLPVRVETTSADGVKTVIEYKNLQVGPLPADTFKLPPGVKVTDMNKMMEQLPSGFPGAGKQP